MVVPFGVIVGVAIVCIVVAVLSSAQRADVIAVDHEKQSAAEISARLQSPGAFLPVEVAALAS